MCELGVKDKGIVNYHQCCLQSVSKVEMIALVEKNRNIFRPEYPQRIRIELPSLSLIPDRKHLLYLCPLQVKQIVGEFRRSGALLFMNTSSIREQILRIHAH